MKGLRATGLLVAGLFLLAPPAAAEVQRPHETITIGLPTRNGFFVYASVYPQKRVAVFGAQTAVEQGIRAWGSSASYVKRVPRRSLGEIMHIDFGSLGRIDGRVVAEGPAQVGHVSRFCRGRRPVSESGHFVGNLAFRGDGGYLDASAHRAPIAIIRRTFRLHCKKGRAAQFDNPAPGLFGYVQASTSYVSNTDGTYLRAVRRDDHVVTEFMALDHFGATTIGLKAVAREWLSGDIAATRSIEVEDAPAAAFSLGEPDRRPDTAAVHPPPPFSGAAEYTRSLGPLDGDLAVSFLGKELPLAGPTSEAEVCARPDQRYFWDCK